MTNVSLSKSALQRLSQEYRQALDEVRTEEAKAMVRMPGQEEEVCWREVLEPDSPMMNVSSDGAMIHIIGEGWGPRGTPVDCLDVLWPL